MVQVLLSDAHARLALLPLAVSALLFATTATAATIGTTQIDSAQHEPISATIEVRDIDPDSFSAAIAPNSVYQQMNMNADVAIDVRFVKTSSSTGKIILTSAQPVSDPFADVVLTVNDKGRQQTVPKTLLLPLSGARRAGQTTSKVIGTTPRPNLPQISNTTVSNALPPVTTMGKPLAIKRQAPPPLLPSQAKPPSQAQGTLATPAPPAQNSATAQPTLTIAAKPQVATASPALIIPPIPDTVTPISMQPNRLSQPSTPMLTKLLKDYQNAPMPAAANQQATRPALSTLDKPQAQNQAATSTAANQAQPNVSAPVSNNLAPAPAPANTPAVAPTVSAMNTQLDMVTTTITRRYSVIPPDAVKPAAAPVAANQAQPLGIPSAIDSNGIDRVDNVDNKVNDNVANNVANNVDNTKIDNSIDNNINNNIDAKTATKTATKTDAKTDRAAADTLQATTLESSAAPVTDNGAATKPAQASVDANPAMAATSAIPLGEVTYTVQKNDNLWTIAQQIATKNKMSVAQVMDEIQAYNPDAFIGGEKSKLLASVPLALPAYEVIPSRLGVQAAKEARQTAKQATKQVNDQTQTQAQARPATKTEAQQVPPAPTKPVAPKPTANKPKPTVAKNGSASNVLPNNKPAPARPSLTLVTPHKNGRTAGTSPTAGSGGSGLNPELVATLKSSRQKTATQAQRVGALNQELSERTRTLQLQNQRLANLERRLKKLRGK